MRQTHSPPQSRHREENTVNGNINIGIDIGIGGLGNAPGGLGNSTSRHAGANLASGGIFT
jgi:hypothetical protein